MTEDEALKALRGGDAGAAARAHALLWEMWHRSGDREIDALLREGIATMERRDLAEAEAIFARLIAKAPAFAEGWNKRATVRYVAENFEGSIADCEETLKRNPNHFGALSGQGLCYMALGRHREAAAVFRRALVVHPHLGSVRQNLAAALGEAVRGNGHR
jgi:tetratricopeptide (TPR) repeat protein